MKVYFLKPGTEIEESVLLTYTKIECVYEDCKILGGYDSPEAYSDQHYRSLSSYGSHAKPPTQYFTRVIVEKVINGRTVEFCSELLQISKDKLRMDLIINEPFYLYYDRNNLNFYFFIIILKHD